MAPTAMTQRRWLAPEIVQSSAMDCGPAALKCLLEGFRIPVSYGRLREACQTDVDGTSIDTIEVVANELGVQAEQIMIPADHALLRSANILPALAVVRHADGGSHFVVVWRRFGAWLQVMDPSIGRRWVHERDFPDELFRHELSVPASGWREWAGSDDFLAPLRERLQRLGGDASARALLVDAALADEGWFALGALDASIRLVHSLLLAEGIKHGPEAIRLVRALFRQTCDSTLDIFTIIPRDYWSVSPDPNSTQDDQRLMLRGAVMLRVSQRRDGDGAETGETRARPLSRELAAALSQDAPTPLRSIWGLLKTDGILAPAALCGAMIVAAAAAVIEALLMRGIFDIGALLHLGSQRLLAPSWRSSSVCTFRSSPSRCASDG
jgi:predicted double-glycine peptidase